MQAVILCGGKGTRLLPQTRFLPKSMVPINEKPFLEYVLSYLKSQDIYDILLLTGYLGNQIVDYFKDGNKFGLNISYCREAEPMGTGSALKKAAKYLEETFFLIFGDTYFPISYNDLNKWYREHPVTGTIAVYNNRDNQYISNVSLGQNHIILGYNKRNSQGMTFVDAGVAVFNKGILDWIPDQTPSSLEEDVYPKLIERNHLSGFLTTQAFYDIGTRERVERFKEYCIYNNLK